MPSGFAKTVSTRSLTAPTSKAPVCDFGSSKCAQRGAGSAIEHAL